MRNVKRRRPRRLPPKKKAERVWCFGMDLSKPTKTRSLEGLTKKVFGYIGPIRKDAGVARRLQARWHVRCPNCNRRVHPQVNLLGSEREFHYFSMPRHKEKRK